MAEGEKPKLRAILVDDEELARDVLRELLAPIEDVEVVAECANGFEAVEAAARLSPDLLFLDIQMPGLDGFEVLQLLDPAPAVIFVTAYDEYAVKAFEVHAVDYLLKPYSRERLASALARARERLAAGRKPDAPSPALLAGSARPPDVRLARIAVRDGPRVVLIPVDALEWAKAEDDYVLLAASGREHLKQQTLASLEASLDPARFARVHRSYLLNLALLSRFERSPAGGGTAILTTGARIPVSRAGMARLRHVLENASGSAREA